MSRVRVKVARAADGSLVSPATVRAGPFACVECGQPLVHRRGEVNRWHFAHLPTARAGNDEDGEDDEDGDDEDGCAGGTGESLLHRTAKEFLAQHLGRFAFRHGACDECGDGEDDMYRFPGPGTTETAVGEYVVDVALADAAFEVLHTHACSVRKLADLRARFGVNRVFEVRATDILDEDTIERVEDGRSPAVLESVASWVHAECARQAERKRQRPCGNCGTWRDRNELDEFDRDTVFVPGNRFPFVYLCKTCTAPCPVCRRTCPKKQLQTYYRCLDCNQARKQVQERAYAFLSSPSTVTRDSWEADAEWLADECAHFDLPKLVASIRVACARMRRMPAATVILQRWCRRRYARLYLLRSLLKQSRRQHAEAEAAKQARELARQAHEAARQAQEAARQAQEAARLEREKELQTALDTLKRAQDGSLSGGIRLNVPFENKDSAKAHGALWDASSKSWYAVGPAARYRELAAFMSPLLAEAVQRLPAAPIKRKLGAPPAEENQHKITKFFVN